MADENASGIRTTAVKVLKTGLTSVFGLVSGVVIMYVTGFFNIALKPAKPVANFATQAAGLTVTFNNRSTGGVDGWWDFGDGNALEPYSPKVPVLTHTYDKPGTYNVKLSLSNLLREPSERTVAINVDAANTAKPEIELFEVTPYSSSERAPALYRLQGKVKNAAFCILDSGDEKPFKLDTSGTNLEHYFSFDDMGSYTIRLAVVSGKDIVEKSKTVYVSPNEGIEPTAKLRASYEAVRVDRIQKRFRIHCGWQGDVKENTCPIQETRLANNGYEFVDLEIVNKDDLEAPVRNMKCEISSDKKQFKLVGELVKSSALLEPTILPRWQAEVKAVMQRRSAPVIVNRGEVAMTVHLNSTVKIPMQPLEDGWEAVSRQATLELWEGPRKVWESNKSVTNGKVTLKNQQCNITTIQQKGGIVLKIDAPTVTPVQASEPPPPAPVPPALLTAPAEKPLVARPAGFERVPGLPTRTKKKATPADEQ